MKRILRRSLAAAAVVLAAGCAHRTDLTQPQTQDNFGVRMARLNLWREAMFRFRRAVQMPDAKGTTEVLGPPDRPEATNKPRPTPPPAAQPTDIPPEPQPPPPPPPPGGSR